MRVTDIANDCGVRRLYTMTIQSDGYIRDSTDETIYTPNSQKAVHTVTIQNDGCIP